LTSVCYGLADVAVSRHGNKPVTDGCCSRCALFSGPTPYARRSQASYGSDALAAAGVQGSLILKILRGKYPPVTGYSKELTDIVKSCLTLVRTFRWLHRARKHHPGFLEKQNS